MSEKYDEIDEELIKEYFIEASSQIEILEKNALILEENTGNKDAIDSLFRAAHTLKGGSATVKINEVAQITHLIEDIFDDIRSNKIAVNSEIIDLIFESIDTIKEMIAARSNNSVYDDDITAIETKLKNIIESDSGESKNMKKSGLGSNSENKLTGQFKLSEYDVLELIESNKPGHTLFYVYVTFDESNVMKTVGGIQIFTSLKNVASVLKSVPDFDELYADNFFENVLYIVSSPESIDKIKEYGTMPDVTKNVEVWPVDVSELEIENKEPDQKKIEIDKTQISDIDVAKSKENQISKKPEVKSKETVVPTSNVLRVDAKKIDSLLNLVSEIVINKATFNQIAAQMSNVNEIFSNIIANYKEKLKEFIENLPEQIEKLLKGKSISEIKKFAQKEMQELTDIFDDPRNQNKIINDKFKLTSQNLDRISASLQESVMSVRMVQIKQIFSRFPRLVRDLSRSLEKKVNLSIEGEETELDKSVIEDLLDPLIHIVRNAIDHGLESPEVREKNGKESTGNLTLNARNEGNLIIIEVSDDGKGINKEKIIKKARALKVISEKKIVNDRDAFNLLFEPGFSTAQKITDVSGRGVGLDVVRNNIEKLNGSIEISSELNMGTTFTLKLPLTLAIIQGLLVNVANEVYAIPISSIIESIRIKPSDVNKIDNYEVINVRDNVLSLLRLQKIFRIPQNGTSDFYYAVIVGTGSRKIGLLVDSLIGEEDIVIKPLKDRYTCVPGISGATILGDGRVSFILDITQLLDLGLKIEQNKKVI